MGLVVAITSLSVVFDGWQWEVDLLCPVPWLSGLFCNSRVLAGYSDFGLQIARVVHFQMYCGLGGVGTGVLLGTYSCRVVQARIGSRSISSIVINKRH